MEDGRTIDLLSIGIVAEDGREFYRQNAGADLHKANVWVKENVLPRLLSCPKGLLQIAHRGAKCGHPECPWRPTYLIGRELVEFVGYSVTADPLKINKPEFWGYYADYDWVAVCQLFGRMIDLPSGWPMYCRDLKQWADDLQAELPAQSSNEHNALADARWNKDIHYYLSEEVKYRARLGNKQEISAREIDQKPGHVRSAQEKRRIKVRSGGDLERGAEENGQARQAQIERKLGDVPPKGVNHA